MTAFKTFFATLFSVVLIWGWAAPPAKAQEADIIIGAGATSTTHYDVARALCRQVQRSVQGMTCAALMKDAGDATEPIAVMSDLRIAALEMGLVPSDWQYHAFQGSGPLKFMDIKFDNLRALFSLHGEPLTLIVRKDAGINAVGDLAGKRINIGTPGSQQRQMMNMVMKAQGWTRSSFQFVDELPETEQSLALCHDRVQAVVSTVAHPNQSVARTLELCDAKIIPVTGNAIDKLVADNRFLAPTFIPMDAYGGGEAVKTFGVTLTALSSADMEEDLIYTVVKSVFDDLNRFKRMHRALNNLLPGRMMTDGLSAPLHPGALRYFREKGMM